MQNERNGVPIGVITVDGPAGSGKSTVSRLLARGLGLLYLDTGAMYRAVALAARRAGLGAGDAEGLKELCRTLELRFRTDEDPPRLLLRNEDVSLAIRSPEMDMLSSELSAVPEVRQAMRAMQRRMAEGRGVVAEGRDMGTVVFPQSRHKFFLTADAGVRAERRYRERLARGEKVSLEEVQGELCRRDGQDQSRALAPLRPAGDALVIDSTRLTVAQVVEEMTRRVEAG